MNRFLYALDNPATLIDPDGHMAATCGGAGCGGLLAPTPTSGLTTGGDCSQACIDSLNYVSGINTHGDVGAPGYTGGRGAFTGYAPWELDADEQFTTLYAEATAGCMFHGTDRDSNEACQFADALSAWRQQNEELYCSFHKAECDSRTAHTILGLAGMVPVLGIAFNGADAILYISEGDLIGAGIAIGSSIPLAGALGKVGRVGGDAVRAALETTHLSPFAKGEAAKSWSKAAALARGEDILGEEVDLIFNIGGRNVAVRADLLTRAGNAITYIESKYSRAASYTRNQALVIPELVRAGDAGLTATIGARTGGLRQLTRGATLQVTFQGDVWTKMGKLLE
jgi:hypothetical protein